jgi:hypothetical protein
LEIVSGTQSLGLGPEPAPNDSDSSGATWYGVEGVCEEKRALGQECVGNADGTVR